MEFFSHQSRDIAWDIDRLTKSYEPRNNKSLFGSDTIILSDTIIILIVYFWMTLKVCLKYKQEEIISFWFGVGKEKQNPKKCVDVTEAMHLNYFNVLFYVWILFPIFHPK